MLVIKRSFKRRHMDFSFTKRVAFHETDCMGVVHHSVYAKYFEEARVEWLYAHGVEKTHSPFTDYVLAVLDLKVSFLSPLKLGDVFRVEMRGEFKGAKLEFRYKILLEDKLKVTGSTLHIGVDSDLKVQKPPLELKKKVDAFLPKFKEEDGKVSR